MFPDTKIGISLTELKKLHNPMTNQENSGGGER